MSMNEFLQRRRRNLRMGLLVVITMFFSVANAQKSQVTGKVKDEQTGETLPGVNVVIKGTSSGTVTDADGNFSLEAASDDVLVFTFVGFASREVAVAGRTTMEILLTTDITSLEEVVVVGYGTQKKSVVTGSISSVKGTDLESMPITRIEQALQGRTSGVTIAANSGQPGSSATVRVRGITTLNNNDPLYVVDGVVVDNGGIGYINQSDIESIEVLKDAASQAIYGARAAAGVIMVTTKKGKSGSLQVNYNGFFGTSAPARKLDLLNATQYATLRNEASVANGDGIVFADPTVFGEGTDWQNAIFNNSASRQNHELSLSGGNEKSTFYTSFGYLDQEGIVASDISQYKRINARFNSIHKISKYVTFGQNLGYAYTKSVGLGNTNSEFGGPLSSAINLDPLTPLVETDPAKANEYPDEAVRNEAGYPYGISDDVGQELTNPLAYIKTRLGNYSWAHDIVGNVFAEVEPLKGFKFRSTLGGKIAFWGSESFTPIYLLNGSTRSQNTSFNRSSNQVFNWNIENTISYSKTFNAHDVTVLLGQGAYQDNKSLGTSVTYFNVPADNFDDASMNYNVPNTDRNSSGYEGALHTVSSLFARVNYTYDEKYMVTAIARRDGSSRFGSNNKYGFFPSFSLGWVASREDFFPSIESINFLKIRGGYGVVGNDNIGDFAFLSTIGSGRNYTIRDDGTYSVGYSPNAPSNPDLKWEQTSQVNIGFEATVLNDFTVTFDWFKKETIDILQTPRIPGYIGAISDPAANVGSMKNSGVELELGYNKQIGEVEFSVNGNVSYMENEVTYLGKGIDYLSGGQTFQASSYAITRTAVGQPLGSFYGFENLGIFQTTEDVLNHTNTEGVVIQPNAKPGDFIWADLDDNGIIDEKDRTFIGNPTPNWSFGITLTAEYKGFDFMIFGQGVAGNKIFQGLRRLDVLYANWQTEAMGRWTGPGTSNDFPRMITGDPNENFSSPSKFYLEDGDYFRMKTVQIGYTLPKNLVSKIGLQRTRVYVMSENLITFTKYTGYDPEIGGGVMSIDRGIYPQARSFMLGLNVGF